MPQGSMPQRVPVPVLIPTSKFPHLKRIVETLMCLCPECTKVNATPSWFKFKDALESGWVEPIAGPAIPGRQQVSAQGMIATSFTVFCPNCGGPAGTPTDNGVLDLSVIPKDWVQTFTAGAASAAPVSYDGDIPVAKMPKGPILSMEDEAPRGKRGAKKITDLNPASRVQARKLEQDRENARKALERANKAGLLGKAVKENQTPSNYRQFRTAQEVPAGKKGQVSTV